MGRGWSPATTDCSGRAVTRNARTEAIRVAVLVESLTVPAWVEWTVAQIDADGRVRAHGGGAGRRRPPAYAAAVDSPRGARLAYRLYEWVDSEGVRSGSVPCATADLSADLLWADDVAGIGPLDVVVSFLPADRTAWDGPTPRHGVWAIAPMDDGRPASAPEPLLGAARTQPTPASAAVVAARRRLHAT